MLMLSIRFVLVIVCQRGRIKFPAFLLYGNCFTVSVFWLEAVVRESPGHYKTSSRM
jgi:hypothetical protein